MWRWAGRCAICVMRQAMPVRTTRRTGSRSRRCLLIATPLKWTPGPRLPKSLAAARSPSTRSTIADRPAGGGAGIDTPNFQLMNTGRERLDKQFTRWPLMVKPVAEGSSKGVISKSVCHNEAELREVVKEMVDRYQQPALVEEYIGGREFTVGLLGERRPEVLPPMEIVFTDKSDKTPIYKFEDKLEENDRIRYEVPAKVEPAQLERLRASARTAFMSLGCRDVARIDFRMDENGPHLFHRVQPAAGPDPRLERPGADRPGRRHGLPHAHRGDPHGRDPPVQGARLTTP